MSQHLSWNILVKRENGVASTSELERPPAAVVSEINPTACWEHLGEVAVTVYRRLKASRQVRWKIYPPLLEYFTFEEEMPTCDAIQRGGGEYGSRVSICLDPLPCLLYGA